MEIIIPDLSHLGILVDSSSPFYQHLFELILKYKYFVLIPLTILEGPVAMLGAGFLVRLEVFEFWPAYFSLMIGDLLGDIFWYGIGYYLGNPFISRFGKYVSVSESRVETVRKLFHRYHNRILIISKVTMGFGFALVILITAGLSKIPFSKYISLNAIGQIFWTALLLVAGYFAGHFYTSASSILGEITSFGLLVILFGCLIGFGKYIQKRALNRLTP